MPGVGVGVTAKDSDLGISAHRLEQAGEIWCHQRLDNGAINPRRGRLKQRDTHAASGVRKGTIMQAEHIGWTHTSHNGSNWVRRDLEDGYTYDSDGDDNARSSKIRYFYESSYGNLIRVEERAANGTTVLRRTETTYNTTGTLTSKHIVNRPARVQVKRRQRHLHRRGALRL